MTREEQLAAAESALAKMLDLARDEESVDFTTDERAVVIAALEICAGICTLLCGR